MASKSEKKARLFIISGPSGVGKSTICREVARRTGAFLSISATTRPKSDKETDGQDYYFMSKETFEKKIENSEFLEYADVFGNYYGTPKEKVDEALEQGRSVLLEIDVQGGLQVAGQYSDAALIFLLPPTRDDLAERISDRGRGEDEKTARKRLDKAGQETATAWQFYNHMIINDDLETAIQEVMQIVEGNGE